MEIYFLNYLILVRDTHTLRILWGFLLIEVQCFNIYLIKFIYLHFLFTDPNVISNCACIRIFFIRPLLLAWYTRSQGAEYYESFFFPVFNRFKPKKNILHDLKFLYFFHNRISARRNLILFFGFKISLYYII